MTFSGLFPEDGVVSHAGIILHIGGFRAFARSIPAPIVCADDSTKIHDCELISTWTKSVTLKLLAHPMTNKHAKNSVTTPTFRRHPWKNSPMIQVPLAGVGSLVFFGDGTRGLLRRRYTEISVSGMTIDQYGTIHAVMLVIVCGSLRTLFPNRNPQELILQFISIPDK